MLASRPLLMTLAAGLQAGLHVRMCATDLSSLKVVELKDRLRQQGLKVGGNKAELIARLAAAGAEAPASPVESAEEPAAAPTGGLSDSPMGVISILHCKQ